MLARYHGGVVEKALGACVADLRQPMGLEQIPVLEAPLPRGDIVAMVLVGSPIRYT